MQTICTLVKNVYLFDFMAILQCFDSCIIGGRVCTLGTEGIRKFYAKFNFTSNASLIYIKFYTGKVFFVSCETREV